MSEERVREWNLNPGSLKVHNNPLDFLLSDIEANPSGDAKTIKGICLLNYPQQQYARDPSLENRSPGTLKDTLPFCFVIIAVMMLCSVVGG